MLTPRTRKYVLLALVLLAIPVTVAALRPTKPAQFLAVINGGQEVAPVSSGALGVGHFILDDNDMLVYAVSFTGLVGAETAAHIHGPAEAGQNASVVFPFGLGNPKNGAFGPLTAQQKNWLRKGQLYVNIHSAAFPSGEIRGQILAVH